jgi:hypothetical protein
MRCSCSTRAWLRRSLLKQSSLFFEKGLVVLTRPFLFIVDGAILGRRGMTGKRLRIASGEGAPPCGPQLNKVSGNADDTQVVPLGWFDS